MMPFGDEQPRMGAQPPPFPPNDGSDELAALLAEGQEPMAAPDLELPEGFDNASIEETLDLRVRLTDEEQASLGQRLAKEIYFFCSALQDRMNNASVWRDDASMMPDNPVFNDQSDQQNRYAWMARVRSVLTSVAARSAAQKLFQQVVMPHPPFVAVPLQQAYQVNGIELDLVQRGPDVEKAWDSLLDEAGWREACRELFFDELTVVCPTAMKVVWERQTVAVPVRKLQQDTEQMLALGQAGVNPQEAIVESIATDRAGKPKVNVEFEERVVQEGPVFSIIPLEDLIWLPVTARHQKDAFAVGERVRLSGSFLTKERDNKRGGYFPEVIDELLQTASDPPSYWEELYQDRAAIDADTPTAEELPEHKEFACVELAYKGRLKNEKGDRWYWLTVHPASQRVLRACYMLDRHGMCPYEIMNYFGSKLMGMSVGELNAVPQNAYTTLWNNFLDLVNILQASGASFAIDPSALPLGMDVNMFTLAPGRQLPLRRPKDNLAPLPIADNIPQALQAIILALGELKKDSQLLTSTSNVSLGKEAEGDKTLGEIQLVFGQDQAISEVNGYGVALAMARILEKFRQLEAQYCRTTKRRFVTESDDGTGLQHLFIEPELLAAPYRIIPAGLTASASASTRYQKAAMAMQAVATNPLTAQIPEIMFEALQSLLQALGVPQATKWITIAKQAYAQQQMMLQQQQAQQVVLQQQAGAQDQANAEAEHGLKRDQLALQAGQQQQQNQLARDGQGLQALDLISKLTQPPAAANGGVKK